MKRLLLFLLLPLSLFVIYFIWTPKYFYTKAPECIECLEPQGYGQLLDVLENHTPEDFRYFFNTFIISTDTLMNVSFRNDTCCFDINLDVDHWDKLGGMLQVNGLCYPDELYGLTWKVSNNQSVRQVEYIDMRTIID